MMPGTKRWENMKTEDKPLITVVTITYCKFDRIYDCISSVLNQDYPNIEYIISDDGSSNFEQEKIEKYVRENQKSNLKGFCILTHEQNVGTVRNINGAYRRAHGEYIINVSGDDAFYTNDVVSRIVDKAMILKPEVMAVSRIAVGSGDKKLYYLPHSSFVRRLSSFSREKQFCKYASGQYYAMYSGSALIYKKEFMDKMGYFDEKYTLWEDGPFVAKTLLVTKIIPAYDIVGIKYSVGGVSGNNTNPTLARDVEIYNRTTRRENANKLGLFYRALALFNIRKNVGLNYSERLIIALMLIPICFYKLGYSMNYKITENIDKKILQKGGMTDASY